MNRSLTAKLLLVALFILVGSSLRASLVEGLWTTDYFYLTQIFIDGCEPKEAVARTHQLAPFTHNDDVLPGHGREYQGNAPRPSSRTRSGWLVNLEGVCVCSG